MRHVSKRWLRPLEAWSSRLVLLGGISLAGHGTVSAIDAFSGMQTPPDVFAPLGYTIAIIGLLGIAPGLIENAPTLGRGALVAGVITIVGWLAILAEMVGSALGIVWGGGGLPDFVWLPLLVAMFTTYVLFATTTRVAGRRPRSLWLLLLVPPTLLVALVVGATVLGAPNGGAFVIGVGQCIAHLSIGVVLRGTERLSVTATAEDASTS